MQSLRSPSLRSSSRGRMDSHQTISPLLSTGRVTLVIVVSLQLKGNAIETETDLLAIPLVFCAAYRPIPAGPAPITTVGRIAAIRCVRLADFE